MPRQGLRVMTEQTRKFIAENPTDVVLSRRVESDDGSGGTSLGPAVAQDPQTMRIVPQSASAASEVRTTSGEMLKPTAVLIALPDANVERGDSLVIDGIRHEVAWVRRLGYEISADVVAR